MNHVELFAGVGGFRMAMDNISKDTSFNIQTVAFSEIDKKAIATYCANYNVKKELALGDIVKVVNDEKTLAQIPHFDLLSGGFPCQTFSMMGEQAGFGEERGQMFFRIMDMVYRFHPNFILLENVKNLINHDRGRTISVIKNEIENAGYYFHYDVFNSNDFGLPQKRCRVIMFARKKEFGDFSFSTKLVKNSFESIDRKSCSLNFYSNVLNILDKKVDEKYYLSEKIKPTILSDGSAGFKSKSDIDQIISRPLTATMHKMHRACQDNYYSDNFILSKGKDRPINYLSKAELAQLRIRRLTPKEAFLLQGFPKYFSSKATKANVANGAQYKQAGNAVSVNTIYAVLNYLINNNIIFE